MTSHPLQRYQHITDFLANLYGNVLYERHGIRYPMRIYPPHPDQTDQVDSVLGHLTPSYLQSERFAFYNMGYLQNLKNSRKHLFNGTTFSFKRLRPTPTLRLDATLGRYFDTLATSYALGQELQDASHDRFIRLPSRTLLHRQVVPQRTMTSGEGRDAALGGVTLIVFNHHGIYKTMLVQRSSRAAVGAGMIQPLPAFIFQPAHDTDQLSADDWSLERQIMREILEELFGVPEDQPQPMSQHPAYRYLRDLMAQGLASLHLTGVSLNLMTLRAEICTLLLIRTPDWYERISATHSDMPLNATAETDDGHIQLIPIEHEAQLLAALGTEFYLNMPPSGLASLWLGIDFARQRLNLDN